MVGTDEDIPSSSSFGGKNTDNRKYTFRSSSFLILMTTGTCSPTYPKHSAISSSTARGRETKLPSASIYESDGSAYLTTDASSLTGVTAPFAVYQQVCS
jgi:hypothetical protein